MSVITAMKRRSRILRVSRNMNVMKQTILHKRALNNEFNELIIRVVDSYNAWVADYHYYCQTVTLPSLVIERLRLAHRRLPNTIQ